MFFSFTTAVLYGCPYVNWNIWWCCLGAADGSHGAFDVSYAQSQELSFLWLCCMLCYKMFSAQMMSPKTCYIAWLVYQITVVRHPSAHGHLTGTFKSLGGGLLHEHLIKTEKKRDFPKFGGGCLDEYGRLDSELRYTLSGLMLSLFWQMRYPKLIADSCKI